MNVPVPVTVMLLCLMLAPEAVFCAFCRLTLTTWKCSLPWWCQSPPRCRSLSKRAACTPRRSPWKRRPKLRTSRCYFHSHTVLPCASQPLLRHHAGWRTSAGGRHGSPQPLYPAVVVRVPIACHHLNVVLHRTGARTGAHGRADRHPRGGGEAGRPRGGARPGASAGRGGGPPPEARGFHGCVAAVNACQSPRSPAKKATTAPQRASVRPDPCAHTLSCLPGPMLHHQHTAKNCFPSQMCRKADGGC